MNASNSTLFNYFDEAIKVINTTLVPLIFALAFVYFLINIYRYFILNGDDPTSQKKGKAFVLYGVVGFAVMLSVWGLVNIIINTFYLQNPARPCLPTFGTTNPCSGTTPASTGSQTALPPFSDTSYWTLKASDYQTQPSAQTTAPNSAPSPAPSYTSAPSTQPTPVNNMRVPVGKYQTDIPM